MSDQINRGTPVNLTLGSFVGTVATAVVASIAACWAIVSFTSTGLRDDVSAIRASLSTLQGSDKDNALNIKQAELDFTRQVDSLNVNLTSFGTKFDSVNKSIDRLSDQMAIVQKQVSTPPVSFNPTALVQTLKKAGLDGKTIVVVPYDAGAVPAAQ